MAVNTGSRAGMIVMFVLFVATEYARAAAPGACEVAMRGMVMKGFSGEDVLLMPANGSLCQHSCCSQELESKIYKYVQQYVDQYLKESIIKMVSLIETRARRFDEFFRQMMNHSRLEFHSMFERTYGKIYLENSEVFADFFKELESYYNKGTVRLSETMETFFGILYQRIFTVLNQQYQFDERYLSCVAENMADMQPFGDVPKKLGLQLRRSFVATRTLYKALSKAASAAGQMALIHVNDACLRRIIRMQLCGTCTGTVMPSCSSYCSEILSGCLRGHAELSDTWDSFVDAVEKVSDRLTGSYDIEAVVEPLNIKISEAIMIFQENGAKISEKIFAKCGNPQSLNRPKRKAVFKNRIEDSPNMEMKLETMDGVQKEMFGKKKTKKVHPKNDIPELKKILLDIKMIVKDTKQFWLQLPYQYCNYPGISSSPEEIHCWNGTVGGTFNKSWTKPDIINNSPIINEQIYILRGLTDKLKKAFHGQEVEIIDDTEETMAGSGSGSGDGENYEEEGIIGRNDKNGDVYIERETSSTTTTSESPPVVDSTSYANKSSMSLTRALVQYLLPVVMVWFGGAIRELL